MPPTISGYKHDMNFANIGKSGFWKKGKQNPLGVTMSKNLNLENIFCISVKKSRGKTCLRKTL